MIISNAKSNSYAVSDIIGGFLLIGIAILAFSSIYLYVFPLPIESPPSNIKLVGYVSNEGTAIIEHVGGDILKNYKIDVLDKTGVNLYSGVFSEENDYLAIGEYIEVIPEVLKIDYENYYKFYVYTENRDGNYECIFEGILRGKAELISDSLSSENINLISSLRTDSIDEDLICYNLNDSISDNATSLIYRWLKNGNPINEILMPFDTNNSSSCKDYSGHGHNGVIFGPEWYSNGIRGGNYYFDGGSDSISIELTSIFNSISENDFTISIWLFSKDFSDDMRMLLQIKQDHKNFISVFQYGNELHFGVSQSGIKNAVRTEDLNNDTWYHIALVWDSIGKSQLIYVNGIPFNKTGYRNYPYGSHTGISLGSGTASSRYWWGYIDEFLIFDKVLSQEQIHQLYMDQKDDDFNSSVIVSDETKINEVWQCEIIPNNGLEDGIPIGSNYLQIVDYSGG